MLMTASDKVDVVCAILATGIYRRWWWANYKPTDKQAAVRAEWLRVVPLFTVNEIREGLSRWADRFGVDNPPPAAAFADYLRPVHSEVSRQFFLL
jgi:hypothetical protein